MNEKICRPCLDGDCSRCLDCPHKCSKGTAGQPDKGLDFYKQIGRKSPRIERPTATPSGGAMSEAHTTDTVHTWKQHWCITGWYMTAKFWIFKRRYFVCTECGKSWRAKDHALHLRLYKATPNQSERTE